MVDFYTYNPSECFFAAANGYSGFRSYFGKIFNPRDFSRVFILKGGPGTGKSSFMKKVHRHFSDMGLKTDTILCSSDPKSLDGVLIVRKNKRIGILDGTAPHEWDTKTPGAVDELINLGSSWDEERLVESRNLIEKLNLEKANFYKSAYTYLGLAGKVANVRMKIVNEETQDNYKELAKHFFNNIRDKKFGRKCESKIYSAFCREGYYRLDLSNIPHLYAYSLDLKNGIEHIFINELIELAKGEGVEFTAYKSPFSDTLYEGVLIGSTLFYIEIEFGERIDFEGTVPDINKESRKQVLRFLEEENRLLSYAKDDFALASKAHFALEKIYTPAMRFDAINEACEYVIKKSKNILFDD